MIDRWKYGIVYIRARRETTHERWVIRELSSDPTGNQILLFGSNLEHKQH